MSSTPPALLELPHSNHSRVRAEAPTSEPAARSEESQDLGAAAPASPPYKAHASQPNLFVPASSPTPSYRSVNEPNVSAKGKSKAAGPPDQGPEDDDDVVSNADTDGDDDDGDYDWSDEEDLVDVEAKFEERMGAHKQTTGWGVKRIFTLLFSSLIGSTFLAALLVAPAVLLVFFWYKRDETAYRHRVTVNVEAWLFWAAANLLVSWTLAMIIDVIPSLARFLLNAFWGHVPAYIESRIEIYNHTKNAVKPIFYAASGWVSWIIIFDHIFHMYPGTDSRHANHEAYTDTLYQVVEFFFFLTLVLSLQRLLSLLIAFAFHRRAFQERIDAVHETLRVVEQLRAYAPKQLRAGNLAAQFWSGFTPPVLDRDGFGFAPKRFAPSRQQSAGSVVDDHRYPPTRGDPDATLVGTAAKALKDVVLHDARNIKGEDEAGYLQLNSPSEAKRLARTIFTALKHPSRNYLLPRDFEPAFGGSARAADAAFRVFDADNNGDLSRAEVKTTLLKMCKERRALARSMQDVGEAMATLDQLLLLGALGVQFFLSLSIFGVDIASSLSSIYTLGIGASFVFRAAASGAFDAIVFLFVTHPFDTGDRCIVDNEVVVVKKMTLFATVFQRADGVESYYFNSLLANKFIVNVRRSGKTYENLTMQVAWRTPLAKLDALEAAVNRWLSTEENRWFVPSTGVTLQTISFQRYIEFTMGIGHNGTWQDWGLRNARKTAFHAAVQHYCRELGIVFYHSPQPVVWGDPNLSLPPYDADAGSGPPVPEPEAGVAKSTTSSMLGFSPPASASSGQARARKHGKKAAMRAAGADG